MGNIAAVMNNDEQLGRNRGPTESIAPLNTNPRAQRTPQQSLEAQVAAELRHPHGGKLSLPTMVALAFPGSPSYHRAVLMPQRSSAPDFIGAGGNQFFFATGV